MGFMSLYTFVCEIDDFEVGILNLPHESGSIWKPWWGVVFERYH